ncbi:hypothetical protein AJ79_01136 [Helicocarpus griseus UAMH5409]|uniref:Uncharacterized protein n=1 Tax=Helicocarpus griseus UAMH5409 TaxID=1447875 RepID=A0A2B7Y7R4_9EURO|nr:hypothetical protein AJ79_01136 [Helicocarpus griseus UAMH5409]
MGTWALLFLLLLLFLVLGYISWILLTHHRFRRAGLPPPPLASFIPFTASFTTHHRYQDSSYPTPRSAGLSGWIKDKWEALRHRRVRGGRAYEETRGEGAARGAAGGYDDVWDSRVGEGGYYEEQELGFAQAGARAGRGGEGRFYGEGDTAYQGAGAAVVPPQPATISTTTVDLGAGEEDLERGRSRSRESPVVGGGGAAAAAQENPFGDGAERSNLGDGGAGAGAGAGVGPAAGRGRSGDRRSAFRESL